MRWIDFSQNWNGKLCLNVFTTIRLYDIDRYQDAHFYTVRLKDEELGIAQLISRYPFKYKHLNDRTATIDSGNGLPYLQTVLKKMYGEKLTDETDLYLLFFRWTERYIKPTQNLFKAHWNKIIEQTPHITNHQLDITF